MLYHFLISLQPQFSVLNVTRYITFRTAAASMTALVISLVMGPWLIRRLRDFQIGQVIRQEGPESHRAKAGTPTMGGLLILAAALIPTLLWADLSNVYVWIAVVTTAEARQPAANTTSPAARTRRRPYRSPSAPQVSIRPANTTV